MFAQALPAAGRLSWTTGVNLVQLRDTVAKFAQLVQDLPELATAKINPLLATADKFVALNARMISNGKTDEL